MGLQKKIHLSIFLVSFFYQCFGQDTLKTKLFDISEVEVVAYQSYGRLKSLAGTVSVVQINDSHSGDINILPSLRGTPGLFVQEGTAGTVKLTLRGIGSRYAYGTKKIKMFFDDIPLYSAEGETTFDDINPRYLSRIEILRGPASSIYGASLGGTIILYPETVTNSSPEIKLRGTVGSYGYQNHSLSYANGNAKYNLIISYSGTSSTGFRQNNSYARNSLFVYYKRKINEKLTNSLLITGSVTKSQIPSSVDSASFFNSPEKAAPTWLKTKGYEYPIRFMAGYKLLFKPQKKWDLAASIYGTWRETEENRPFNFLRETGLTYGTRLLAIYSKVWGTTAFRWVSGSNLFFENYQSSLLENVNGTGTIGQLQQKGRQNIYQTDVFSQAEIKYQRITLTGGLNANRSGFRFTDQFPMDSLDQTGSYQFGAVLSPRVSLLWNPYADVYIYSSVNHGFSAPSLSESQSPFGLINLDIKPEKALSFEGGIRFHLFGKYTYVDIASYYMAVKDLIVPKRIGEDAYIGMNAGSSLHRGIEIDLRQKLFERKAGPHQKRFSATVQITGSVNRYNFEDFVDNGTDYSGKNLPGMPQKSFNTQFDAVFGGFFAGFAINTSGNIPLTDANNRYAAPYTVLNSKVGYGHTFARNWAVDAILSVNNLSNQHYASMVVVNAPGTAARPPRYYYPAMPRWFSVTLLVTYKKHTEKAQ